MMNFANSHKLITKTVLC